MISSLSIRNFALIQSLLIEPDKGLNIITGETGAGKSIILGAVGLLLGSRADTKSLLDKDVKCIVEGEFNIKDLNLKSLFEVNDLDYEDQSIIRREISPAGKSRAFINDLPVTLDVLKKVGSRLIDIHSQNESVQLGDKSTKIQIIDSYAQCEDLLEKYQEVFSRRNEVKKELEKLENQDATSKQDQDYKQFLLDELVKAELNADEQTGLEEELSLLENAEEIKLSLSQIANEFDGMEMSINDRLKETIQALGKISDFSKDIEALRNRFENAAEEIIDVVRDLTIEQDKVEHDPERISTINERLNLINTLQQKHNVATVEELLAIQKNLDDESKGVLDLEASITEKKKELEGLNKQMVEAAEDLSDRRRASIDIFSNSINDLLTDVGMPEGKLEMVYKRVEPWVKGIDEVELLFSANKGIAPEPVAKVASGGEFSRLMFCIKYLLAEKTAMPTVIFDEIDTGVSGEIAIKLAAMMREMSSRHQIVSISHLPQVAAKGSSHYYVYKDSQSDKAQSLIRKLDNEERLHEIAKMIGGDSPSETAKESARELIAKT